MINSIAFTVYPVSNMDRARHFYEDVLGLRPTHDAQAQWVEYDIGSETFAITTVDMGHPPGAKAAVVAFEVDDLDSFVKMLKEKPVPFAVEIIETPVCRMAVIEDPDENHITIHKRKGVRDDLCGAATENIS